MSSGTYKPCPFCGSCEIVVDKACDCRFSTVSCNDCGAEISGSCFKKSDGRKTWINQRLQIKHFCKLLDARVKRAWNKRSTK